MIKRPRDFNQLVKLMIGIRHGASRRRADSDGRAIGGHARRRHRDDAKAAKLYNFCGIHETLRVTPAMEAGIAHTVLEVEDIVKLVEGAAEVQAPEDVQQTLKVI